MSPVISSTFHTMKYFVPSQTNDFNLGQCYTSTATGILHSSKACAKPRVAEIFKQSPPDRLVGRMRSWPVGNSAKDSTRHYVLTTIALVVGFVAGVAYKQTAVVTEYRQVNVDDESYRIAAKGGPGTASACKVVTQYISSDLEQAWLAKAAEWEKDYCTVISKPNQLRGVEIWMDTLARAKNGASGSIGQGCDPAVFSRFVTTARCGFHTETVTTWIEPLSHGLRHPNNFCGRHNNTGALFDMSYLLLAQQADTTLLRSAQRQSCGDRPCQSIYLDLGATVWSNNETEAGQGWFVRNYAKKGIIFDRLLLWEAKPIQPPSKVYQQLPLNLLHKYQYFNMPATDNLALPSHPMNVLKQIAQPGDFVVMKLDIDNASIEMAMLQAFLEDQEAFSLVDEFFFEHHVSFEPMKRYWVHTADPNTTLPDSYQLFLKLRQNGWRAHSWV